MLVKTCSTILKQRGGGIPAEFIDDLNGNATKHITINYLLIAIFKGSFCLDNDT